MTNLSPIIPRDPVRAEAFDRACDEVAQECMDAIRCGDDVLAHKELLAILNDDGKTARRMRELDARRKRLGLRVIRSPG